MASDNIETVKRAVEINACIRILPETAIIEELASGTTKAASFSNQRFVRPTGMVVRRGRGFSQAGRYLVGLLRKQV